MGVYASNFKVEQMLGEIFTSQRQFINHFFDHIDVGLAEKVLGEFLKCEGMLIFTGVGKSGIIADKVAKTMISTGTRAMYLPPTGAMHGDIGLVSDKDLVVMLSKSGKSSELMELARYVRKRNASSMAWVSTKDTPLDKFVDHSILLPLEGEICPFDLAPTTSTAVQLIFGDVISVALMRAKKFTLDQFALNHPAGAIGKLIAQRVEDVMVKGEGLPLCNPTDKLKDLLVNLSEKRLGCLLVVDDNQKLLGVFTDGDLRRALASEGSDLLNLPISDLMISNPLTIAPMVLTSTALELMEGEKKVLVLPVIEAEKVVGIIHLHHIIDKRVSV